jgi:hypothetical protein
MLHWFIWDYNHKRAQSKIKKGGWGAEEGYDLKQTKHKEKKKLQKIS